MSLVIIDVIFQPIGDEEQATVIDTIDSKRSMLLHCIPLLTVASYVRSYLGLFICEFDHHLSSVI